MCSRVQYLGSLSRHVDQERMQAQRGEGQAIAMATVKSRPDMPLLTLSIGGASPPGLMTRPFEKWDTGTGAAVSEFHTEAHSLCTYEQAGHPRRRDRVDWGVPFMAPLDYNSISAC